MEYIHYLNNTLMIKKYILYRICFHKSKIYKNLSFSSHISKWITKKNLKTGYLEEYRSCLVLLKSAAYHSLSRSSDIYVPLGSGSRSQITPPRSQVNWITSVSVSPSSLCHRCRNGAPTKGIDGRSKRRSGTRVLPRRRFDMSVRDRSSPSCMEETSAQISEKREGAQAQKRRRRRRRKKAKGAGWQRNGSCKKKKKVSSDGSHPNEISKYRPG